MIHADYFPDNVLFVQNQIGGVIDFYFACNDFYVYDLAIMLNSWCFELDGSYNITKGQAVIQAYRAARSLGEGGDRRPARLDARRCAALPADPHL